MLSNTDPRPPPMTGPECDLRGLEYMPLHGTALFGSTFYCAATDAEFRAGFALWWAAWNQIPAGSLPGDDAALCRLAGLGRDLKAWAKVRPRALHGFVLCNDDRLYHEFLCRQVLVAWEKRVKARVRKATWRASAKGSGNAPVPRDKTETAQGRPRPVPDEGKGRDEVPSTKGLCSFPSGKEHPAPPAGQSPVGPLPAGRPSLAAVATDAAHAPERKTNSQQPLTRGNSQQPGEEWRDSEKGIIARGLELGQPPFDLDVAERGPSPAWTAHQVLVFKAHNASIAAPSTRKAAR